MKVSDLQSPQPKFISLCNLGRLDFLAHSPRADPSGIIYGDIIVAACDCHAGRSTSVLLSGREKVAAMLPLADGAAFAPMHVKRADIDGNVGFEGADKDAEGSARVPLARIQRPFHCSKAAQGLSRHVAISLLSGRASKAKASCCKSAWEHALSLCFPSSEIMLNLLHCKSHLFPPAYGAQHAIGRVAGIFSKGGKIMMALRDPLNEFAAQMNALGDAEEHASARAAQVGSPIIVCGLVEARKLRSRFHSNRLFASDGRMIKQFLLARARCR